MLRLWEAFQARITNDEDGASMVEYALLVALIAIIAIVAVALVGTSVSTTFSEIASSL
ncbi:MAG: Flp family type IVb pilin [Armatimonadetes bacterium]|nr:MAG: Flp family type IVb pilin [Armatimonadota bacterium]